MSQNFDIGPGFYLMQKTGNFLIFFKDKSVIVTQISMLKKYQEKMHFYISRKSNITIS